MQTKKNSGNHTRYFHKTSMCTAVLNESIAATGSNVRIGF